ncbi:cobalamin biosynthesis protein CobG [Streptomyces sp. C10-9-1]|uniref:cobalamin biosynthesis protein CobG n=1 Tax=Streptomyces sp. C10-9-1 TaxID=1859285 RepID=UPI003D75B462
MLTAMPPPPANHLNRDETPVRERGDACPGALRLHTADDGALARVRLPAGVLTARQAHSLAEAAERLGDGALHLTSRGNLQLRGLGAACGGPLAELLHGAGLLPAPRHERVRNIVASPFSGLDGRGTRDVQPLARELDALLCASERAAALSGRFLFALDDGRGDMAGLGADVTLRAAAVEDAHPGAPADREAAVVVAGGAAVRVPCADGPRTMLLAAEAFLDAAEASGTRAWRVAELPPGRGPSTSALLDRAAAAGIAAEAAPVPRPGPAVPPPAPGHRPPSAGRAASGGAPPGAAYVLAPLGRLTAAQWRAAADLADRRGTGELRATPWRGLVLPGLPARFLPALAEAGLVTDPASPWHGTGACIGRPGCAKALSDVRADATAAVSGTPGGGPPGDLPVYWSGCERRCGHPHGARIDVVATGDGRYDLTVAGGTGPQPSPADHPDPPAAALPGLDPGRLAAALAAVRSAPAHHRPSTTK